MKKILGASVLLSGALLMTACSPANQNDSTSAEATAMSMTSSAAASATKATDSNAVLSMENAVVRASAEGSDMTAVFGTVVNNTDQEVHVTGFSADVDAQSFEIHEVVNGMMQPKAGGLVIPANGSVELAPGGDHMMILGLAAPVQAGDEVTITLDLEDGSTVELEPVPARTIAAGDEDYGTSMDHSEMAH
ncbi:copper chaperone PCu(A)C [Corynebacterium callunae]|uniref:copper chaperone PCu(A)C n=1 Tax=Corynebacterium callunae TaxID=1721 RepID=UPI00398230B3